MQWHSCKKFIKITLVKVAPVGLTSPLYLGFFMRLVRLLMFGSVAVWDEYKRRNEVIVIHLLNTDKN